MYVNIYVRQWKYFQKVVFDIKNMNNYIREGQYFMRGFFPISGIQAFWINSTVKGGGGERGLNVKTQVLNTFIFNFN